MREITKTSDGYMLTVTTDYEITVRTEKPLPEETKMDLQCLYQGGPEITFEVVDSLEKVWEDHHRMPW